MPSSVVAHFSYDAATAVLRVVYVSGMVYEYKNVPEEIYRNMRSSDSKGGYLNRHIKGKFPFNKIR